MFKMAIAGGFAASLLLLSGIASAPACAQAYPQDRDALYAAAQKEGRLVWYEGAPLQQMTALAGEFMKQYPGIKVEIQRAPGNELYQKFVDETGAKRYIVDVMQITDEPLTVALHDAGQLADWKVPTHDRFPAGFRLGEYAYAQYPLDANIVYNINKVTPEEAKILASSWKGVLDPRFKGRIAVTNQKCGACYATLSMFIDPKMAKEYGWDYLKAVAAQKPAVYPDIVVALDRVIAGERDIMWGDADGHAFANWQKGAPIRWVRPAPTPYYGNSWQTISKFAPHPNAARLFQTWSMGEDGALAMERTYGAASSMDGVPDIRSVKKEAWYPPVPARFDIDFKRWSTDYDKVMDMWIKILKESEH